MADETKLVGPAKGNFIAPPAVIDRDEPGDALPTQEEFWRSPVRFGSVPVEKEPLGWDRRHRFRKLFPHVSLPFQVVERVPFGRPELEPNRLFWGDNLHVMRQLPSASIDLIYLDPPFFSGRHYNVIFGDQNELRSFSDIWERGMPGYLVWLNARLYEMKRLLKRTATSMCIWIAVNVHRAKEAHAPAAARPRSAMPPSAHCINAQRHAMRQQAQALGIANSLIKLQGSSGLRGSRLAQVSFVFCISAMRTVRNGPVV
jgi:hypothetical protein